MVTVVHRKLRKIMTVWDREGWRICSALFAISFNYFLVQSGGKYTIVSPIESIPLGFLNGFEWDISEGIHQDSDIERGNRNLSAFIFRLLQSTHASNTVLYTGIQVQVSEDKWVKLKVLYSHNGYLFFIVLSIVNTLIYKKELVKLYSRFPRLSPLLTII